MLIGNLILIYSATIAIAGTFLLDYLTPKTMHPERLEFVFGAVGIFLGFGSLAFAIVMFTNNFSKGFKKGGDL